MNKTRQLASLALAVVTLAGTSAFAESRHFESRHARRVSRHARAVRRASTVRRSGTPARSQVTVEGRRGDSSRNRSASVERRREARSVEPRGEARTSEPRRKARVQERRTRAPHGPSERAKDRVQGASRRPEQRLRTTSSDRTAAANESRTATATATTALPQRRPFQNNGRYERDDPLRAPTATVSRTITPAASRAAALRRRLPRLDRRGAYPFFVPTRTTITTGSASA